MFENLLSSFFVDIFMLPFQNFHSVPWSKSALPKQKFIFKTFPGSTPLSIGCTSPIFCSRVRCLNPTSIGLPMSILMSRCKTSKWVRLTAVFKRLKFKQKEKKKRFSMGAKPRSLEWYSSALPTTPLYIAF